MLVVMSSQATQEQIDQVILAIQRMKLHPHPMPGPTRTAIGITGNNQRDRRPLARSVARRPGPGSRHKAVQAGQP